MRRLIPKSFSNSAATHSRSACSTEGGGKRQCVALEPISPDIADGQTRGSSMKPHDREKLTETVLLRLTPSQKRLIEDEAARRDRGLASMVRRIIFDWDREQQRRSMADLRE
jgi:hypothetical protein